MLIAPNEQLLNSVDSLQKLPGTIEQNAFIENSKLSQSDKDILYYIFAQSNKDTAKAESCKIFTLSLIHI